MRPTNIGSRIVSAAAASDGRLVQAPHDVFTEIKMASHLFVGIADATMSHGEGWHFARLGRLLERADKTSRILDVKYFILLPAAADVGTPFDDIQWAEPVFLDLIEHVADWSRDAPIFLLCVARPELLEERPAWGGGKLNASTILLEPLPADDPLWSAPNAIHSMHLAGRSQTAMFQRGAALFLDNLAAFRAGRPMRNVVDLDAGY